MAERFKREDEEGGMSAEQFAAAGMRLFPPARWADYMSKAIGRDRSMIWRYATGKMRIPLVVEMSVVGMLAMDSRQKETLIRRISKKIKPDGGWYGNQYQKGVKKRKLKPRVKPDVNPRRSGGESLE